VPGHVDKDEVTALCVCDENIPLPDGQPNARVVFGSADGELAVHDSYEGRRLWTMAVFPRERIVHLAHVSHGHGKCFLVGTDQGKLAFVRNSATIDGIGTKSMDICWTMEEKSLLCGVHEAGLHLFATISVEAKAVHVWDVSPAGNPVDDKVATLLLPDSPSGRAVETAKPVVISADDETTGLPLPVIFTALAFVGPKTAGGGETWALAESVGSASEPEPEPASGGQEEAEEAEQPPVPVAWLVAADSAHMLHAWRVDTWQLLFSWSALDFANQGLGRQPVGCLCPLGAVAGTSSQPASECVLAMDEGDGGGVVLWDLGKIGATWRATKATWLQRSDELVYRELSVMTEHVTWLSRVRLGRSYLACGSYDGKLKVLGESGELVGQLVPDGDDAWSFLDSEDVVEVGPAMDDDDDDEVRELGLAAASKRKRAAAAAVQRAEQAVSSARRKPRAAKQAAAAALEQASKELAAAQEAYLEQRAERQTESIFAELDKVSPFYSLMKESSDSGHLVQPYFIDQLEASSKDPRCGGRCVLFSGRFD
jgi:hypothetical protein